MDELSIPVLPHLPAVESWRESTQLTAPRHSPRLQILNDALEAYENSFRRYGVASQGYYLKLNARQGEPGLGADPALQSARELAQTAYARGVHDFEAVEVAFSLWIGSRDGAPALSEARELETLLKAGRSRLGPRSESKRSSRGLRHSVTPRR